MNNKKTKIGLLFASSLAFFAVSATALVGATDNSKVEAKAASPTITTTTPSTVSLSKSNVTIDLNDLSDSDIRQYYASAAGFSGTDLLAQLKTIIITNPLNTSKPAQYYSYSNVRDIYNITDRQWSLYNVNGYSGSNSVGNGSYSSTTNKITNYSYKDDPYLHFYYRDDNESNPHTGSTRQTSTESGVSNHSMLCQEHLWSKTLGFKPTSGSGSPNAGTDLHHLVAADFAVNSWAHSNLSWGNVQESVTNNDFYDTATKWGSNESASGHNAIINNKTGTPSNFTEKDQGHLKVFEPQDCDKGDIARALLYMVARYNWIGATDNSNYVEPYLEQVNMVINQTTNSSAGKGPVPFGCLNDLLTWHFNDLPDQYEIHRNNLIYNNYQHTRNPFIDFPDFVSYIWGQPQTNPTSASSKYNPTGTANPATDTINGITTKTLTSISVTTMPTKTSYYKNDDLDTTGLVVTGTYDDNSTGNVTKDCSFSPTTLTTSGTQQITVTHSSGKTTSFNVSVSNTSRTLNSIAVTTMPTKTTYTKGDTLDTTGIVVTGTYSVGDPANVTSVCTFSPTTLSTVGTQQITVTHTSTNKQTTFNVTVNEPVAVPQTISIEKGDYTAGYSSTGTSGTISKTIASANDLSISYSGINTQAEGGSSYSYTMYVYNSTAYGHIYNTTCPSGYYVSNVSASIASGSSAKGKISITFGASAISSVQSSSDTATASSTYSKDNTNQSYGYWNVSTGGYNVRMASISVTYTPIASSSPSISLNTDSAAVTVGNTVTLTATTSGGSGSVEWSSDDDTIATVEDGVVTGVAAGDTTITATYSGVSAVCIVTVTSSAPVDSISLDKASLSLSVGNTGTITATASGSVTWTSSDANVATVDSNGEVTAVANGTATITATCGTASATCTVTVSSSAPIISADGQYFRKIASVDDIKTGKYVLAANVSGTYYALSNSFPSSAGRIGGTAVTVKDNQITASNATNYIVNITKSSTTYTISDGNSGYLAYSGSSTGLIKSDSSTDSKSLWTIALASDMTDKGTFEFANSSRYLRFSAGTTLTFGSYTATTTNYYNIEIFKEEQASAYAATFMGAFTCDNGAHEPSFKTGYSWSSLKTDYNALDQADREALTGATANEFGSTMEQAVARYDKVVSHWKYDNFMSRSITGLNNRTSFISNDNELFIVIIASSSIVSVTAIGLYMLLKKRKEQ